MRAIEWDFSVGESVKSVVKDRVEAVADLFPGWCEKLTIYFETVDKEGDTLLTCNAKHEYRAIGITIYPLFLQTSDWYNPMIHEIQHGLMRPYVAKVDRLIEKFIKDENMVEFLNDEMSEAEEAVCEDLTVFALKLVEKTRAESVPEPKEKTKK